MIDASLPPPSPAFVARMDSRSDLVVQSKQRGLNQQAQANGVECHVQQLKRYEAGSSKPVLDVIRTLVTALQVSAEMLLFGTDERGPDGGLRLQFEAVSRFDEEEKRVVRSVFEGMILKHEARRWQNVSNGGERK